MTSYGYFLACEEMTMFFAGYHEKVLPALDG